MADIRYDYTVCPNNSPEKFKEACKIISGKYPNAVKNKLIVDVDGSTIQTYTEAGKDINVYDDYDVGAVYVQSEIDLGKIFESCVTKKL